MKVVAIDPSSAKLVGYSLWEDGALLLYGKMPFHWTKNDMSNWVNLFAGFDTLIIEGQFLKQYTNGSNVRGLISLVNAVGALKGCAVLSGVKDVVSIAHMSWRSKMLGGYRLKTPELKKLSKIRASDISHKKIIDDDIADSICIGEFYWKVILPQKNFANASK